MVALGDGHINTSHMTISIIIDRFATFQVDIAEGWYRDELKMTVGYLHWESRLLGHWS
jgi:hypothetical protein